jgi:hypothetical protein
MKDLITEIVQAIVDRPEEVSVTELAAEHTSVLEPMAALLGESQWSLGKIPKSRAHKKFTKVNRSN